jgi:hypothetical protein
MPARPVTSARLGLTHPLRPGDAPPMASITRNVLPPEIDNSLPQASIDIDLPAPATSLDLLPPKPFKAAIPG